MKYLNILVNLSILLILTQAVYYDVEFPIGQGKQVELNKCGKIVLRTSYKRTKIELANPHDIQAILFTDKEMNLGTCGHTDLYEKCKKESNLCTYSTDISTELGYEAGFCAKNIYMYIETTSSEAKLYIDARFVNPVDTQNVNHVCNKINDNNEYIKCAAIPLNECKNSCHFGCQYLSCKEDSKEQFGMCVPETLQNDDRLNYCQIQSGINKYETIDPCDSIVEETKAEVRDHPWVIYLAIFFFIWIGSIWFYNYKLEQTGIPPFPTFCCPEICYPRARVYPDNYYKAADDGNNIQNLNESLDPKQ